MGSLIALGSSAGIIITLILLAKELEANPRGKSGKGGVQAP